MKRQILHALKNEMRDRKISQKKMADDFGVTQQTVSNWLNSRSIMTVDTLKRICQYIGMDLNIKIGNTEIRL